VLAGPGPSDSADPSRTLSGLLPPSRTFPRTGCPLLHWPAATDQRRSHLTSTRFHSASWRTNGYQYLDLTALGRQEAWEEPKGRAVPLDMQVGHPGMRLLDGET
jgi:hypothetical protein